MKRFRLSAFLTITALSVAGLVSHSAAQQGPPATHLRRGHLQRNPQHLRYSRGRASRSWPPVNRRDLCEAAQRQALGWR